MGNHSIGPITGPTGDDANFVLAQINQKLFDGYSHISKLVSPPISASSAGQ